jgi:hypothetical protein
MEDTYEIKIKIKIKIKMLVPFSRFVCCTKKDTHVQSCAVLYKRDMI